MDRTTGYRQGGATWNWRRIAAPIAGPGWEDRASTGFRLMPVGQAVATRYARPFALQTERALAGLTTHILDVTRGGPAERVRIELYELDAGGGRRLVTEATTNADGRTDKPLIGAAEARIGRFELVFHAGDYFRAQGAKLADPPFLDDVPIRFAVADAGAHYHVPLIVSPWSYSTYRGS